MAKTNSAKSAKPKQPSASAKSAAAGGERRGLWRLIYRPVTLIVAAGAFAVVMLEPYVVPKLPDFSERDEYRIALREMTISEAPRWVPPDLIEQLIRDGELPEEASLLDETLVAQVAAALEGHAWIAEVRSVYKSRADGLVAEVVYREPVLMVRTRRGMYPVDRDGLLLPPADFSVADTERFPIAENIASVPTGPAGTAWGDTMVVGAARLAEAIAPDHDMERYWRKFHIRAIRVPDRTQAEVALEDIVYELLTHSGSRIIWGRAPGADDLEPSVTQKLDRLEYVANNGGIDGPGGPYRIDIRHFDVISRRAEPGAGNPVVR